MSSDPLRPESDDLRAGTRPGPGWRRLAVVGGIVSVIVGLILVIWPKATLVVVAVLIGLWLLVAGMLRLVQAAFAPAGRGAAGRVLQAVVGLFFVVVGVLCVRNLTNSLALVAAIIAVAWLFGGVAEIFAAFSTGANGWDRVGAAVLGFISIVGAVVVLFWPAISLTIIVWVVGLWLIAMGIVQIILGMAYKNRAKNVYGE